MRLINGVEYFTPQELKKNGMSPLGDQTLRVYVKKGVLGCMKIGNRHYFSREQLDSLITEIAPHAPNRNIIA